VIDALGSAAATWWCTPSAGRSGSTGWSAIGSRAVAHRAEDARRRRALPAPVADAPRAARWCAPQGSP
jgi:hypothetical protein